MLQLQSRLAVTSPDDGSTGGSETPRKIERPKRISINIACETCRKMKLRTVEIMQEVESLRAETAAYRELFHQLHTRPEAEATSIFHQIRDQDDCRQILSLVRTADLLIQPSMAATTPILHTSPLWGLAQRELNLYVFALAPQNLSLGNTLRPRELNEVLQRSDLSGIARDEAIIRRTAASFFDIPGVSGVFDNRIYSISAKVWTKVPCEDSRCSDLLQLYFLIDHPFYEFFDRDLFLDDLVSGHTQFCSELLVNSLLCYACHLSEQIEHRNEPWHTKNLASHFYQEARRLWQLEETKATLTTIQASVILTVIMVCEGKNKVGNLFMLHGVNMAIDLGLLQTSASATPKPISQKKTFKAETVTAWSVYNYQALLAFHLRLQPLQKYQPRFPIPHIELYEAGLFGNFFQAKSYIDRDAFYFAALRVKHCELCQHMNGIAQVLAREDKPTQRLEAMAWEKALRLYNNFKIWYDYMPEQMKVRAYTVPQHIAFHAHCNMGLVVLGDFLIRHASQEALSLSIIDALHTNQGQCYASMRQIVEQHARRFSFKATSSVWFTFLAIVAADCLENIDQLASQVALQYCIKGLKDMTNITYIANSVFQSLCASAEKIRPDLSPGIQGGAVGDQTLELQKIISHTYSDFPSDYLTKRASTQNRSDIILRSLAGMSIHNHDSPTTHSLSEEES